VFAKHGGLFGLHGIYTTALVVWSFLSQTLRDGKEASCQSAVACVVSYCEQTGMPAPTEDSLARWAAELGTYTDHRRLVDSAHSIVGKKHSVTKYDIPRAATDDSKPKPSATYDRQCHSGQRPLDTGRSGRWLAPSSL
jgi:hypothetical protein